MGVTVLSFNQANGFVVTGPAAGEALVSMSTPSFVSMTVTGSGTDDPITIHAPAGTSTPYTITYPSYTGTVAVADPATGFLSPTYLPGVTLRWVKVATVGYAAFSIAANTNTISTGYVLPAMAVVHGVIVKHTASFTGGAVATCVLTVGKTGTTNYYASGLNVFAAPGNTAPNFKTQSTGTGAFPTPEDFGATTIVTMTAVTTGAFLNALTAGSVDLWLCLGTLP